MWAPRWVDLADVTWYVVAYSEGNIKDQRLREMWPNSFQRYREPLLTKHNPLIGSAGPAPDRPYSLGQSGGSAVSPASSGGACP